MKSEVLNLLKAAGDNLLSNEADLEQVLDSDLPARVQTINLHHIQLANESYGFRETIAQADRITADGWPVVWFYRCLGYKTSRVTGSGYVLSLLDSRACRPKKVALVGAGAVAGDLFSERLIEAGRQLVFREHGRVDEWNASDIARQINESGSELVLVAVTPPKGEMFSAELGRAGCKKPIIGVGGSIDMAVHMKSRAPRWLQSAGFEWLFRLFLEPRRLARRYLVDGLSTFVSQLVPVYLRIQR